MLFQTHALLIIGWLTLFSAVMGYAFLKPNSRIGSVVRDAAQTRVWAELGDAYYKMVSRLVPTIAIITLTLLNLVVASKILTESEAEELSTLIDLGFTVIGAHEIVAYLMLLWAMAPFLHFFFRVITSDEMRDEIGIGTS